MLVGSMAAFALARIQYAPRFGNIMIFVLLLIVVIFTTIYTACLGGCHQALRWHFSFLTPRSSWILQDVAEEW